MSSCEYESLGLGTRCAGPSDAYNAHDEAVYINPRYDSKLGADRSAEEYCEEYCNNNQGCLGYLADGNYQALGLSAFGIYELPCWISIQRPTGVYNDNLNFRSTCMRKIDGSCSLLPTPSPTAPTTEDFRERNLSCTDCIAQGCTYCKGEDRFDNLSLCICGDLSGGFFQGCSDYSFGADELTSKLDCPGGKENGEATLPIIVIIPALIFLCVCCLGCWYAYQSRISAQSNSQPTTTNNNATSAAAAEYPDAGIRQTHMPVSVASMVATIALDVNPSPYAPMATAVPISGTEPSLQGEVSPSAPPLDSVYDQMMNDLRN